MDWVFWDSLTLHDPILEPDRMRMPVSVRIGDQVHTYTCFNKYEFPCLTPGKPVDQNLARLNSIMPAINLGLFTRRIIFEFPLPREDQQAIAYLLELTAKETVINKLLRPNRYIRAEYLVDRFEPRTRYLAAELIWGGTDRVPGVDSLNPDRFCVSASGGKESLLSYGILRELGVETHPVFYNEAGGHWITALKSYRWFRENAANVSRVWSNSDRLLAWYQRLLPILSPHAHAGPDVDPITCFLIEIMSLAMIPVMFRRGVGNLVIGNEYDTTQRRRISRTTHYNTYYDQSRYFDDYMTRWFARKKWPLRQFSILRSCSEFLIQKILGQRYPDLLKIQISCHRAHLEGTGVYPCGTCEKCTRVLSMAMANGLNPSDLGYRERDVARLSRGLIRHTLHQESCAVQHLLARLHGLGIQVPLARPDLRGVPVVEQLRFDGSHSFIDTVPEPIRRPVFKILLDHANGAVKMEKRRWQDVDLFSLSSAPTEFQSEVVAPAHPPPAEMSFSEAALDQEEYAPS